MSGWLPATVSTTVRNIRNADRSLTLRVFTGADAFRRHAEKHFTLPSEPWHRVFGTEAVRQIRTACQDSGGANLSSTEAEAYRQVARGLGDAIRWAAAFPLYQVVSQHFADRGDHYRVNYFFLARQGCVLICDERYVRTGYFPSGGPSHQSEYTRFRHSWQLLQTRFRRKSYRTPREGKVVLDKVVRVAEEHWQDAPPALPPRGKLQAGDAPPPSSDANRAGQGAQPESAHAQAYRRKLEAIRKQLDGNHED